MSEDRCTIVRMLAYQPSMLDSFTLDAPTLDAGLDASLDAGLDAGPDAGPWLAPLTTIRRHPLIRGAWVDHLPGWVRGSDRVLERLLDDVPWRAERRPMYERTVDVPRLLSWYDAGAALPHPLLADAHAALNRHYAAELHEEFVTAGLCLYRDGRDSVAWHGDTIGRGSHVDTMVAIVSFGSPRALMLRPRGGGASVRFPVGHGDLLVMGGSCQRTWEHAIPKTARPVGPRVSVQFRPIGVS
jgi:alkylated DNA repair dioxygenase AlkB